jgi:lipopolysaccharide export system protein LptC
MTCTAAEGQLTYNCSHGCDPFLPEAPATRAASGVMSQLKNLRTTLLVALLIAAAGASWYLSRPRMKPPSASVEDGTVLGYYLDSVVIFGTDAGGNVLYEVRAARAEERPDERRLVLRQIEVEYRPIAEIDWRLEAAAGEGSMDDGVFRLDGGVELTSPPAPDGNSTVIRTAALTFEAEQSLARSDEAVTVLIGSEAVEAVGLRAYLKENRLELDSNIHAQFNR